MKAWRRGAAAAVFASLAVGVAVPACAQARAQVQTQPPAKKKAAAPAKKVAAPAKAAAASAPAGAAPGAAYSEQFGAVCAACHGPSGRSDMPGVPVLAGQPSLYTITQLFLFREGRRNNEAMVALAKTMKDADLRGYSDYIGTLPPVPPPPPATPPDAARMAKGQALAQEHKCVFCHGPGLDGGQQVPRIGGQKEDYVLAALKGFKSGERPGYTRAMTEAMSHVPEGDLDVLAYYVANFRGQ